MTLTYLGQAGLYFDFGEFSFMVDPYISDRCGELNPASRRRVPYDAALLSLRPDVILVTHDHMDHLDEASLNAYVTSDKQVTLLASENASKKCRNLKCAPYANIVRFSPHTEWTVGNVTFRSVRACHSEITAVGCVFTFADKTYYITGDTLYNTDILADLPHVDAVFLPVNGVGNNMNFADAARFCQKLGAKAYPLHCGLFDSIDRRAWGYDNKVILDYYRTYEL